MVDVDKVRVEARTILDKFGKQLENIKISPHLIKKSSETGVRDEKNGESCDSNFKTIMFKNAPKKDDECIILEKGAWI